MMLSWLKQQLNEIEVQNELKCFSNGAEALSYLKNTSEQTFLILSDINMPRLNGLQLKAEINKDERLKKKAIPFVLLSTVASKKEVTRGFEVMVQVFFKKPTKFDELKHLLRKIISYWDTDQHPNYLLSWPYQFNLLNKMEQWEVVWDQKSIVKDWDTRKIAGTCKINISLLQEINIDRIFPAWIFLVYALPCS